MHKMEETKFFTKSTRKKNFLETCLPRGIFSPAWCKRSLLYDQTIEDINIFSPAFLIELRGMAQLTPLSPTYTQTSTLHTPLLLSEGLEEREQ